MRIGTWLSKRQTARSIFEDGCWFLSGSTSRRAMHACGNFLLNGWSHSVASCPEFMSPSREIQSNPMMSKGGRN